MRLKFICIYPLQKSYKVLAYLDAKILCEIEMPDVHDEECVWYRIVRFCYFSYRTCTHRVYAASSIKTSIHVNDHISIVISIESTFNVSKPVIKEEKDKSD